eukprot:13266854-Ditylum_brightwellii.AAC.1
MLTGRHKHSGTPNVSSPSPKSIRTFPVTGEVLPIVLVQKPNPCTSQKMFELGRLTNAVNLFAPSFSCINWFERSLRNSWWVCVAAFCSAGIIALNYLAMPPPATKRIPNHTMLLYVLAVAPPSIAAPVSLLPAPFMDVPAVGRDVSSFSGAPAPV